MSLSSDLEREVHLQEADVKSFADLRSEVIEPGLCGKCGGCTSFCSAGGLQALGLDHDGYPQYIDEARCLKCGICYLICPVTRDLATEVRARFGWKPPLGVYQTIVSARATDESILSVATDGGVVTSLLLRMLERHVIDGAIVSRRTGIFSREPLVATTPEEIITAAGSQFSGTAHLEQLGQQYTTYSPTISAVKDLEGRRLHRIALVGTPCQVSTVRKMQCLHIIPADVITHTIGLFCVENLTFEAPAAERLMERWGVHLEEVVKLNIKDDLIFTVGDGRMVHVPLTEVEELARPACLACTEFANAYADISVGGLGSPDGYTTTLIRTDKGRQAYNDALRHGCIEERTFRDLGERRSEKTKMLAKVMAFARLKKERGTARRRELGLNGGESSE